LGYNTCYRAARIFHGYLLPRQVHQIRYLLGAMVTTKPFHSSYQSNHGLLRCLTFAAILTRRANTQKTLIFCLPTSGFEPTADRPEAKGACVNIAPINPLSHHGSVFWTNIAPIVFHQIFLPQFCHRVHTCFQIT
jgi:hypothetical protein